MEKCTLRKVTFQEKTTFVEGFCEAILRFSVSVIVRCQIKKGIKFG